MLRGTEQVSSGSQSGANTDDRGPGLPWSRLSCCRFESLQEPLRERRAALEARSRLLQFLRDADEEMAWVQEKLPLATSQDCGQSLSTVRHLQEKHQVWEPSPTSVGRGCPQIEPTAQLAHGVRSPVLLGDFGETLGSLSAIRTRNSSGPSLQEPVRLLAQLWGPPRSVQ